MSSRFVALAATAGAGLLASCGASGTPRTATATRQAAKATRCSARGARSVLVGRETRVFSLGGSIYGCSERTGRRSLLGSAGVCIGSERAGPFALSGETVGYALERCGVDTGTTELIARRLTDGMRLRIAPAIHGVLGPESFVTVGSIVVAGDGALAWIASAASVATHRQAREVDRADRSGFSTLDSGSAINAGSLALHGSTLSWRRGSSTRSAALR
jgi:hypothetical protein